MVDPLREEIRDLHRDAVHAVVVIAPLGHPVARDQPQALMALPVLSESSPQFIERTDSLVVHKLPDDGQ